jgi:hypothetical protein
MYMRVNRSTMTVVEWQIFGEREIAKIIGPTNQKINCEACDKYSLKFMMRKFTVFTLSPRNPIGWISHRNAFFVPISCF